MTVTGYGKTSYSVNKDEAAQLDYAAELWEKLYDVKPTKHLIIMSAVNSLVARLETELVND